MALTSTVGSSNTIYDYADDNSGRTTAISTIGGYSQTLSYDNQGRLAGVHLINGSTTLTETQTYNASGQRSSYAVVRTGPSPEVLTETLLYRGSQIGGVVITLNGSTYSETFLYDQRGQLLEMLRSLGGGVTRYLYVHDGRGNIVGLTDTTGKLVDSYAYDPWGKVLSAMESVPQPFLYAGYWYDRELGWYWLSVRDYNPSIDRFLQPDPSMQEGTLSYVYVRDDPVDRTDPSGLDGDDFESHGAIGGGPPLSAGGSDNCAFLEGGFCYTNADANFMGDNPSNPYSGISDQALGTLSGTNNDGYVRVPEVNLLSAPEPEGRYLPGIATGGFDLPDVDARWFRGTQGNIARIPGQIAAQLRGRSFKSFNDFRQQFWKAIAGDTNLSSRFSDNNRRRMAAGLAPISVQGQHYKGAQSYTLHHIYPIQSGGGVYDLDNIIIVTPRFHQEILDPHYHY